MTALTAINKDNVREVGMMTSKAMCAYANYIKEQKRAEENLDAATKSMHVHFADIHASEYEATIRCIEMFVRENLYRIQAVIIDNCWDEGMLA